MSIDNLREQIDAIDSRIVKLIAERMTVTSNIGNDKREIGMPIEDKTRELAVLERIKKIAQTENLAPDEIEQIYERIFLASKEVQGVTVAFQGEIGAYSEEAAYQFFGTKARLKPCENLEDTFPSVERGDVRYGLVPVENSLEGSIPRTYDLLLDSNLKVAGETQLRIIHCLIGLPDAQIDSIREVYSHPQALGQCKTFLRQMGWKLTPTYDTSGSVKVIKENGLQDKAAIASARSAEIYGMKILVRSIEDNIHNYTRFFVLAKQDAQPTGCDKTSIVFSVKHEPGALYDALKEMASRKINLTKIESRPTRQKPWEYNFYADFDGHHEDASIREALQSVGKAAIFVRILGSYPRIREK
jgi:chorismate mutase / prephenate dehydratase